MRTIVRVASCLVALGTILFAAIYVCDFIQPEPLPQPLGTLWSDIRVGMPQSEVLKIIEMSDKSVDNYRFKGRTRDGQTFSGMFSFDGLPDEDEVVNAELEVWFEQGGELHIKLGPGGRVLEKSIRSGDLLQDLAYNVLRKSK